MPSSRLARIVVSSVLATLALVGTVSAREPGLGVGVIALEFVVLLVVYLLLGGAVFGFGPEYTRETITELRDDFGAAGLWGLLVTIGTTIVLVLLALTIIGLVVAIPGFIALFVVSVVGTGIMVVWVGDSLTHSHGEIRGSAVLIGALALAFVSIVPVLGGLITFVLGLLTFGVVCKRLYHGWKNSGRRSVSRKPP